jgi:hypothetical protein
MVFLVMTLLLILFLAFVVDFLLTEEEVKKWRVATKEFRDRFKELDVFAATEASNLWFLGLFKAIYGERFLSRRRLIASVISTLLAMVLVAYIFQIFSLDGFHVLHHGLLSGLVVVTVVNFIADYLSLQETFWIMQFSQKRRFFGILLLSVLDLVATSAIYVAIVAAVGFLMLSYEDELESLVNFLGEPQFVLVDFEVGLGIFFGILGASTYVTSLLWICFVGSAFAMRVLQIASPALQRLISIIGASERPAFAVAGFLCAMVTVTYGASQAILWAGERLL